ncbi:MAG TPA: hypothetical protein VE757_07245 [Gaiellaceae bacterium]|nr:hypothetical protein [Gaiellaceae bacterium]
MIEGDGSPDRVLARGVLPVKPAWRADSLAVAYVDARGRGSSFDLTTDSTRAFDTSRCGGTADGVFYSRNSRALAVYTARGVAVVRRWSRPPRCRTLAPSLSRIGGGWLASGQLVNGRLFGRLHVSGVDVGPEGSTAALAVPRRAGVLAIGIVSDPHAGRTAQPRWLAELKARPTGISISWR